MNDATIFDVIRSGDYLILDTETTGLDSTSEICQIAIIDSTGNVLLDTLVKPVRPIPAEATAIHGITDEMVADAKNFDHKQILSFIGTKNVIVYNSEYDVQMLYQSQFAVEGMQLSTAWWECANWYCAMIAFSEIYGDYNDYRKSYRWQKLSTACAYYKIPVTKAHGAVEDCLSTLAVCKAMAVKEQLIEDAKKL